MKENNAETIKILDNLEEMTGCYFIWKTSAALLVEHQLNDKHCRHINHTCMRIKQKSRDIEIACMRNDTEKISRRALEERSHFINVCHAGIAELVIPIYMGDYYLGVVLCGPFRNAKSFCKYPDCQDEFEKHAWITPKRADAIAEITRAVVKSAPLIMHLADDEDLEIASAETIPDMRIRHTARFIKKNFKRQITLEEAARLVSLSCSRYQHLFKESTGLSFLEYLQRLRISEARRLLIGTGLQMIEVSNACGFADQSRFAAVFKRYFKMSPTAFRQQFYDDNYSGRIFKPFHVK